MFIAAVRRLPSVVVRYAIAVVALAIASGITWVIAHTTGSLPTIEVVYLLAILASAWWGGYGPGILATLLTTFVVPALFTRHFPDPATVNRTQLTLVLLISVLVSSVATARYKVEAALREANELLDERVRARTEELQRANQTLKENEADLLRQADELARSNADLQQFAYVASHDLQEPLRIIAIYTELLGSTYGSKLEGDGHQYFGVIIDGVRRMQTLIRDLLLYSRTIHEDGMPRQQIDASDALRAATFNLEAAIAQSGATIRNAPLPTIAFDRIQLVQMFQNLLSNAIKYRSDAPPLITVAANRGEAEWIFSVQDNGLGIDRQYHETIFDPFKRLHGAEFAGTGVGLAICRRIIQRHGGRLWVESEPGAGSTFFFTVPDAEGMELRSG